ncbi:MAG: DUF1565 domain-containing protein [Candidatus Aminicenantes bacterium]
MKGKRILALFASVCLALVFIAGNGNALILEFQVPSVDYPTIQAGINAAEAAILAGDADRGIVRVAPGTYNAASGESFPITLPSGVELIGAGSGVCVIDAGFSGTVISCFGDASSRVEGFLVKNGGGVVGGSIFCQNGSSPIIVNNIIFGGNILFNGGGIICYTNSFPLIANNIIIGNRARNGGGIYCYYSSPTIVNNTIVGNTGSTFGGGIYLYRLCNPVIANNIIFKNSAGSNGGGIYCYLSPNNPTITYNNVYDNAPLPYVNCPPAIEDMSAYPEFKYFDDEGVDYLAYDYHLESYSPCVDAGTNDYLGYVDFDFEYHLRPLDGDGDDDAIVDIGADEIVPPPVARAGDDQTFSADESGEATVTLDGSGSYDPGGEDLTYEWTGPIGDADGSEPIITVTLGLGEHTFTLTVSNVNGTGTDEVVITVEDTTPPVPSEPSLDDVIGECSAEVATVPTATDNCTEGPIIGTTDDPLVYTVQGTYTVTWTYNDGNGNTFTQGQTVIVDDVTAPVPSEPSLDDVIGECSAEITEAPTATDNCTEGPITGTTSDPLSYTEVGTYTVTWTYDDGNGNSITQEQTVIVQDTIPPAPDAATLPTVTGECSATITEVPTATDNCAGAIGGDTDDPLTYTEQGTHIVTWTYVDGNGNITEQTQTVIVEDKTPPVPDVATLPTLEGECSVEITTAPTASDNCAGAITGTTNGTLPITFDEQGTHTVTWTYTDENGNIATQTQTVKVEDITPPTIHLSDSTCVDVHRWVNANMLTVSATDNCSQDVELVIDKVKVLNRRGRRVWGRGIYRVVGNDIYVFPNGRDWSIVVTVTASDSNGNTATESLSKPLLQCNRWSAKMARLIRLLFYLMWKYHRCW